MGNLPPTDKIRYYLTAEAMQASDPEAVRRYAKPSSAVANGLAGIIGEFIILDSDDPRMKKVLEEMLTDQVTSYGLSSIDELRRATVDLRDQLRQELPEEAWNKYFGTTKDFI